MKHLFITFALLVLFSACTNNENNEAVISGKLLSGNIDNVTFDYIVSNPISGNGDSYIAPVDEKMQFSIKIPAERFSKGRIYGGRFYHDICLLPGDNFSVEIEEDTISYVGKGAEKNNFLYALEVNRLNDRGYYSPYNKGEANLEDFINVMQDLKERRFEFLDNYAGKRKLEPEFVKYFKLNTQVIYDHLIQGYPKRYAYNNKIKEDSLELPDEYIRMKQFANFVDDDKIICSDYLHNMRNFLYAKSRDLIRANKGMDYKKAINTLLIDSLQGKTQEYVMAKCICSNLSFNDYDTTLIDKFQELQKDLFSEQTVNAAIDKYNQKQSLIGQPLHPTFAETLVEDSTKTQLTFGEMMNKYKRKVVYLDIWGLGCGPCRATMPHSKKMKEKLSDLPIEFVYIAQDPPTDDVWENIFKISLTKENHYRMVNHKWGSSKMLKFMEINWVPCYMIFDKEGHLIDFNADRPYVRENGETSLEKKLKELAKV